MKFNKLALATAAAFGLAGAAVADTYYVQEGLETWTVGGKPQTGNNINGGTGTYEAVWFGGGDSDETAVTAYDGDQPTGQLPVIGTGEFAVGDYYLKVSNSNPLWRIIDPDGYAQVNDEWPTDFPEGLEVNVGDGLFIDTLVQFTPSEDAPSVDPANDGSKLVVWMNTNNVLCVTAAKIIAEGDDAGLIVPDNFETTKPIVTNTWYRLTVKAYDTVLSDGATRNVHAFKVYIDGAEVSSAGAVAGASEYAFYPLINDALGDDIAAGKVFFSLSDDASATLAAVGFKGEGLVDDIVVSDVEPTLTPSTLGIDFTLTWGDDVSAAWYSVDGGETKTEVASSGTTVTLADAVAGTTVLTYGGTAVDPWQAVADGSATLAASDNTFALTAADAATAGDAGVTDTFLGGLTPAQVKAAFGNDVTPGDVNSAAAPYWDYQLGQDLSTLAAAPSLKIVDIQPNGDDWDIKVQVLNGTTPLEIDTGDGTTLRATLKVKSADALEDLDDAEPTAYDLSFDEEETDLTITVTAGAFFKAYIE